MDHSNTDIAEPAFPAEVWVMLRNGVATAVLIVMLTLSASAKMRGPSTPEERARALDYIRSLEQKPVGLDTVEKRIWLTDWIVKVPDIVVHMKYPELESLDKVNDTYSNQLRVQAVFSQAAYLLLHPGDKDVARARAAGLAGTLRAYKAIQRFDPTAKYPVLDNLLSLEKQGKLVSYAEQRWREEPCSD